MVPQARDPALQVMDKGASMKSILLFSSLAPHDLAAFPLDLSGHRMNDFHCCRFRFEQQTPSEVDSFLRRANLKFEQVNE